MSEAAPRTGSPWFATFLSRPTSGDASRRCNMATEYGRGGACGLHFLARSGWQARSFLSFCVTLCLVSETLRVRANVCPRTKSIHWRDDLTCFVVVSRASQPPVQGPRYIFVKIFKCAMHRPKTDTRALCLLSDPIPIGMDGRVPFSSEFSFVWDGKPRFMIIRFLENENPVSLDRYIVGYGAFFFAITLFVFI